MIKLQPNNTCQGCYGPAIFSPRLNIICLPPGHHSWCVTHECVLFMWFGEFKHDTAFVHPFIIHGICKPIPCFELDLYTDIFAKLYSTFDSEIYVHCTIICNACKRNSHARTQSLTSLEINFTPLSRC